MAISAIGLRDGVRKLIFCTMSQIDTSKEKISNVLQFVLIKRENAGGESIRSYMRGA